MIFPSCVKEYQSAWSQPGLFDTPENPGMIQIYTKFTKRKGGF
jgi:hypothetical protein